MKINNFKLIEIKGNSPLNRVYTATVDVETGFLFWKKVTTKEICKRYIGGWFFSDTGKFTPRFEVENLFRAWEAKNGVQK